MAITSTAATAAQRAWLEWYEKETGIEPMHQDEFDGGEMTWAELVRSNVRWFRDWSTALLSRLEDQLLDADADAGA